MNSAWRQIWIISLAGLALWAAVLAIAYTAPSAIAQSTEEPAPPADPPPPGESPPPATDGALEDEPQIGAPVTEREELPPELRQSADNNVSFPVDI
jgi:hypothetical protein